jgi:hypothetical protein
MKPIAYEVTLALSIEMYRKIESKNYCVASGWNMLNAILPNFRNLAIGAIDILKNFERMGK